MTPGATEDSSKTSEGANSKEGKALEEPLGEPLGEPEGHREVELYPRRLHPRLAIEAEVIREVHGVTEKRARARGVPTKIAEGRGDLFDVARFLRDNEVTAADVKEEGISLRGKVAAQGVALAGLTDQLWKAVLDGDLKTDLAVVIGRDLPGDVANQQAAVDLLAKMDRLGRHLPDTILAGVIAQVKSGETTLAGVIAQVKSGGTPVATEGTLFGEETIVSGPAMEKAEIVEYVLKELRSRKALFNMESTPAFMRILEAKGNILATDRNLEELTTADMGLKLVRYLAYTKSSTICQALNERAADMVASQNRDQVKRRALDEILTLVKDGRGLQEGVHRGPWSPGPLLLPGVKHLKKEFNSEFWHQVRLTLLSLEMVEQLQRQRNPKLKPYLRLRLTSKARNELLLSKRLRTRRDSSARSSGGKERGGSGGHRR